MNWARTASLMLLFASKPCAFACADSLKIIRQVVFDEKVERGSYRSCSTSISINFHDSTCRPGTDSAAPNSSQIVLTLTYTYLNGFQVLASVRGLSFCESKPSLYELSLWSIRSNDSADISDSWYLDKSSPVASDQKADAILKSEETGIDLEAVRKDGSKFDFDLIAEPKPIWNLNYLALWQASRASHRHCISALERQQAN